MATKVVIVAVRIAPGEPVGTGASDQVIIAGAGLPSGVSKDFGGGLFGFKLICFFT